MKYDTISLGKYKAEQLEEADLLPPPTPGDDDDRSDIDFSYGPVKVSPLGFWYMSQQAATDLGIH